MFSLIGTILLFNPPWTILGYNQLGPLGSIQPELTQPLTQM